MTYLTSWEDFEKNAERLYLQDPMKVICLFSILCYNPDCLFNFHPLCFHHWFQTRYVIDYDHAKGELNMKFTDDVICIQYKTDAAQDVRKMEKFVNGLMRHMASKEPNQA